jgi:predicted CxxxxCH...CXXCH cytochrome family protein
MMNCPFCGFPVIIGDVIKEGPHPQWIGPDYRCGKCSNIRCHGNGIISDGRRILWTDWEEGKAIIKNKV